MSITPVSGPLGNLTTPVDPVPTTSTQPTADSITQASQFVNALFNDKPDLSISGYYKTVSESLRAQRVQQIINQLTDAARRKALFNAAGQQAALLSTILKDIERYNQLQDQLAALDLNQSITDTNNAISAYNDFLALNGSTPYDNLNNSISNYNAAQAAYQAGLTDYSSALTTYQNAQSQYDQAAQDWNTALEQFQLGSITQAELDSAFSTFQSAQSDFNTAQSTFDSAQQTLNTLQTDWQNAKSQLDTSITDYNSYITSKNALLAQANTAIDTWNHLADQASALIQRMNDLRTDSLGLPPLDSPPQIVKQTSDDLYTITDPASDPLKDGVQTGINSVNGQINTTNSFVTGILNPNIQAANSTSSTTYPDVGLGTNVPDLASGFSNLSLTSVAFVDDSYSLITYTPPPIEDIQADTTGVVVTLALAIFAATNDDSEDASNNTPLAKRLFRVTQSNMAGGSGTGVALTTIDQTAVSNSPFLESTLSKQAFEATFNQYGVPLASMLVDQIGALTLPFNQLTGIMSTVPARKILSTGSINPEVTGVVATVAFSLGAIKEFLSLLNSGSMQEQLRNILSQSPEFNALPPDKQEQFIAALATELTNTLLKPVVNELGTILGMPGLTVQLLLLGAGLNGPNALPPFLNQLFFSQSMQKQFNLTPSQSIEITANASKSPGGLMQGTLDELKKQGLATPDSEQRIKAAADESSRQYEKLIASQQEDQKRAYATSLNNNLERQGILDDTQNKRLTEKLINGNLNELDKIALKALQQFGLSRSETEAILKKANDAKNARDGSINPLGAVASRSDLNIQELSTLFNKQLTGHLSNLVGEKAAKETADEYTKLIFGPGDSVASRFQKGEQTLSQAVEYKRDERLLQDFRNSTESLRNPETARSSPRQLGLSLLLSANAGGPATAGTTSADNRLGPTAWTPPPIDIPI